MSHPAATREHHDDFCTTEGWELVRGARGKPVNHHRTYRLALWDGRMLRTRISRPVNSAVYAPSMFTHILRHQLEVTDGTFWACVSDGVLPDRGAPTPPEPAREPVSLYLVRALAEFGVTENEVLELTNAEAAALLARLYASAADDDG